MNGMKTWWVVAALLAAVACTSGCDKLKALGQKGVDSDGTDPSSASGGGGDDAQLSEKVDPYVDCINQVSPAVFNSRRYYLSWCDEKSGPTGKERHVYGLHKLHSTERCKQGIDKAAGLKPSLPEIEKVAAAYKAAVVKLEPIAQKAYDYYHQKNYKDDKMAQGKQMHPELMAAFTAFEKADKDMRAKVAKVKDELQERQLASLEKQEGKKLRWHHVSVMIEAKKLIRLGEVDDVPDLDLPAFSTQLTRYEKALGALDVYAKGHKAETDKVLLFSSFVDAGKEFLSASKEMMRRKRDNKKWTQSERMRLRSNAKWVDGHPAQVMDKYNSFIDASNRLHWRM